MKSKLKSLASWLILLSLTFYRVTIELKVTFFTFSSKNMEKPVEFILQNTIWLYVNAGAED